MTINEYARANGLDPDTALTHMLLFSIVEATELDEKRQRHMFESLIQAVAASKLAASVKELATELIPQVVAQAPTPGPSTDMIEAALPEIRAAYGTVYEAVRFGRQLGQDDLRALHERLERALDALDEDEPAYVREEVNGNALVVTVWNTLQMLDKKGSSDDEE